MILIIALHFVRVIVASQILILPIHSFIYS